MNKKICILILFFVYAEAGNNDRTSEQSPINWTDPDVMPRVTRVKGNHIQQIRTAVNAKRNACGLSDFSWTDAGLSNVKIKKIHIDELRQAINEAYTSSGASVFNFGDAIVDKSTRITRAHIMDLRNAIVGVNCVVNGLCGSAHNNVYASTPASGLCSKGTSSVLSGSGPWNWTCSGSGGGTNQSCSTLIAAPPSAPPANICGSSSMSYASTAPTTGLCNMGVPSPVIWVDNSTTTQAGFYSWNCIVSGVPNECRAFSTPCSGSGTRTWTVGAYTCTGSFWGSNIWTVMQIYPLPSGTAHYVCQRDGTFAATPSTAWCEPLH